MRRLMKSLPTAGGGGHSTLTPTIRQRERLLELPIFVSVSLLFLRVYSMRHSRNSPSNLLLFFGILISQFLPPVEAQTASNTASSTPGGISNTNTSVIIGAVFGAVIGVALMMVSILFWLRRQTRKAREAASLESRKKGRYGTQNTSYGLDTNVTVPTGILSSFNSDQKSIGAVPHPYVHNSYANAPLERPVYEPSHQQSISISNGPIVPYQIPVGGRVESSSSLPTAFPPRPNQLPIIRSLHRTTSDIFKPLPEPPARATSPGVAVPTPPPPPVHSVAFPGLSSPNRQSDDSGEFERSQASHTVTSSVGGVEQGRVFGTFGNIRPPYAPYAQDYRPRGQRRGSDASTSSLGSIIGASGSLARERGHWDATVRSDRVEEPIQDARPRSQSTSSLQYGSQYQEGSTYKYSVSRNPSTTSLSYYPDATSADGLARSYSQTVLARPESRASSLSSKKFENQLFSR